MNRKRLFWGIVFLFQSIMMNQFESQAGESTERLQNLVNSLNQHSFYRLAFEQKNQNLATGQLIEGHGSLKIQKPDRFDWVYQSSPSNRIVCDGHYIVMLTPDTQQAMIEKAESQSVIWSPISVLTHRDFESHYRIELLMETPEKSRYRLYPIRKNQPYDYIEIVVFLEPKPIIFTLVILDLAGNKNTLDFSQFNKVSDDSHIVMPAIPPDYDVTDFQGNPQDFRFF